MVLAMSMDKKMKSIFGLLTHVKIYFYSLETQQLQDANCSTK